RSLSRCCCTVCTRRSRTTSRRATSSCWPPAAPRRLKTSSRRSVSTYATPTRGARPTRSSSRSSTSPSSSASNARGHDPVELREGPLHEDVALIDHLALRARRLLAVAAVELLEDLHAARHGAERREAERIEVLVRDHVHEH